MSVSVPVSYLFNRNDKFEVFLRRCLSQEQFERIRGYERCIVCDGKKLNKAFCYYVISDKSVFITENPPRNILVNVSLTSLTHCEIIDDYPNFLDANLTALSTHMQLRFSTDQAGGAVAHHQDDSTNQNRTSSAVPSTRRRSRQNKKALPGEGIVVSDMHDVRPSTADELQKANKSVLGQLFSKLKPNKESKHDGSTADKQKKAKKPSNAPTVDKTSGKSNAQSVDQDKMKSTDGKAADETEADDDDDDDDNEIYKYDDAVRFVSEEEAKRRQKEKKKDKAKNNERLLDIHFLTNITPLCLLTKISWNNSLITSTLTKEKLFISLMADSKEGMMEFENIHSIFQHFDMFMRQLVTSVKAANLNDYVKMAARFDNCAYHSFAIRRLFWHSPNNVAEVANCAAIFAKEIGLGVPTARVKNALQSIWQKKVYEMRIECLALTLHLLSTFFNETEILNTRTRILEESKNNVVNLLINTLCDAIAYTSRRLFFEKPRASQHQQLTNTEELFEDLLTASAALIYEIILSAQALVHPTQSAHFYNVRWIVAQFEQSPQVKDAIFGLCYDAIQSVAFIPSSKQTSTFHVNASPNMHAIQKRGVGISNNANETNINVSSVAEQPPVISPGRAVQTYRQLFIIDILTYNSSALLSFIREKLTEEFKYFVNMETAAIRVSADYPIRNALLHLLALVRHRIIQKNPSEAIQTAEPPSLNLKGQK